MAKKCTTCGTSNGSGNGANGSVGSNGGVSTGLRGPRGFQGPAGPPGPAGVGSGTPGATGPQGLKGDKGDKGNAGANGAPGATGPAPTLTIGVVQQGTTPAVAITGTTPTYALNFTLPKGDKGDAGTPGAAGLAGVQGNMGSNAVLFKKGDGIVSGTIDVAGGSSYAAVTTIAVSHTSINGYGGSVGTPNGALVWLQGVVKNSYIQLMDAQNSSNFGIYKVTSLGTAGNTHVFNVMVLHANGNIPAVNTELTLSYNIPGQDAIPLTAGGNSTAQGAGEGLIPVGGIIPWGGKSAAVVPTGWLLCDGAVVSQTTYGDLFAMIGSEFDINPVPVGMFSLPNLIDKIPYGSNAANVGTEVGNNAAAITVTGTASVSISIANLPAHTHTLTGLTATTSSAGSHSHTYKMDGDGAGGSSFAQGGNVNSGTSDHNGAIYDNGDHTHDINITGGTIGSTGAAGTTTASGTISGTGTGDNRQKGISMRYIIKY